MGKKYSSQKDSGIFLKTKQRTRGRGYLVNALIVPWPWIFQCPVCRCGRDLSAFWASDGFFLLLYIGSYPWNADAFVVGVYHCLPWRLSTQATRSPFYLHHLVLTSYHWCCLSQLVSLLDVCVLQMFIAPNPLIVTNLIDWYPKTAYSDDKQEQDRLRNK